MRKRLLIGIAATAGLALASASVAFAIVPIYENNFSSGAKFREIKKMSGGKTCKRSHDNKQLLIAIEGGPTECIFRTPVQGDGPGPDHQIEANAKVSRSTSSKIRKQAYVAVGVRSGQKTGYQLRVFPKRGRWEVHRSPSAAEFPIKGSLEDINGIGKTNVLRLTAFGNTVAAQVNGTKVMARTDSKAAQVSGANTTLIAAGEKKSNKIVRASFESVRVRLPNP